MRCARRRASAWRCDVYHVWWDPKLKSRSRARASRILGYHICDWLPPTRDLVSDRGMMGDGVIDLPLIRSWVEAAGYQGFQEVEIFSELDWWKRDPDEVLTHLQGKGQAMLGAVFLGNRKVEVQQASRSDARDRARWCWR